MADELEIDDEGCREYQLKKSLSDKLKEVLPLFKKPQEFELEDVDWLELVASYDYLRRVSKLNDSRADEILNEEKPNLCQYTMLAEQKLKEIPLKPY